MPNNQVSEREAQLAQAFTLGARTSAEDNADELSQAFRERFADDPQLVEHYDIGLNSFNSERVYMGILKDHGRAKYQHNPKENMSYFVTLVTTSGEKTVWGIDLARAISEAGLKCGDTIRLEYKGSEPVKVDAPVKDSHGNVIGHEKISTIRNAWDANQWGGPLHMPSATQGSIPANNTAGEPPPRPGVAPQSAAVPATRLRPSIQPGLSMGQSFMLGAQGLAGLKNVLRTGGAAVNGAVSDFRAAKPEHELKRVLEAAEEQVSKFVRAGIDPNDQALTPAELETRVQRLLKDPANKQSLELLVSSLDKAIHLSSAVLKNGSESGESEEGLQRGIEPLECFLRDHAPVLKSLRYEDQSLFDRLQNGVDRVVAMLAEIIDRLFASAGKGASVHSAPKLGA